MKERSRKGVRSVRTRKDTKRCDMKRKFPGMREKQGTREKSKSVCLLAVGPTLQRQDRGVSWQAEERRWNGIIPCMCNGCRSRDMGIMPGRLSTKSAQERCGTDHPIYTDQREANPLSLRKGSVSFGSQLTRVVTVSYTHLTLPTIYSV